MTATVIDFPPERLTDDPIERLLYSRDLAPVPAILSRTFFKTLPDAVARPADAAQVADVIRQAACAGIPVTPRAAASTSYYNAVPVRGGLVLDVNDLRGDPTLDTERQTVRVLPGVTWFQLDDALRRQGFAVKSYPSSAVAATIGGWVSTQGHGLGSLQYGGLGAQLVSLEVVLPSGQVRSVTRDTNPPLDWFLAAEGTLGVITAAELTVRPRPTAETHHLRAFDDFATLSASSLALAQADPPPFTIFFGDAAYLRLLQAGGFHVPLDPSGPARGLLLVSYQGKASDVERGKALLTKVGGRELPDEVALEEWNLRLFHLRTKRAGPSLLAAEMWLPLRHLGAYLDAVNDLAQRTGQVIGTYGLVVTPQQAQVMSIYPTDEREQTAYLAAIGFTKRLHDLGAKFGGRPYGVGLWNTPYLSRLFPRATLAELRRRKALLDPQGIMNPGKLYAAPFPLWPLTFAPGAGALGLAHGRLGRRSA
ncbi:MAG: FAD-binding oxidoreductase [Anaerolineae bacterium]